MDLDAGQAVTVSENFLREAEELSDEEPDTPDWQKDEWRIAKRIVSTDRFLALPTKFDVDEWGIMLAFSRSLESDDIRGDLCGRSTAPAHSELLKTPSDATGSNQRGLHSARMP